MSRREAGAGGKQVRLSGKMCFPEPGRESEYASEHGVFSLKELQTPMELQIAAALRDAYPMKAIFLAAYDLESDKVLHFNGEILPEEMRGKEKFADIKSRYIDYVHSNDVKRAILTEFKLHEAGMSSSNREEIILECRLLPPSRIGKNYYMWVEITFVIFRGETGNRICCVLARDISAQKQEYHELLRMTNQDPYSTILPRMTFEEFCVSMRGNRSMESWINAVLLIDFASPSGDAAEGIAHVDLLDMIAKINGACINEAHQRKDVCREIYRYHVPAEYA